MRGKGKRRHSRHLVVVKRVPEVEPRRGTGALGTYMTNSSGRRRSLANMSREVLSVWVGLQDVREGASATIGAESCTDESPG